MLVYKTGHKYLPVQPWGYLPIERHSKTFISALHRLHQEAGFMEWVDIMRQKEQLKIYF